MTVFALLGANSLFLLFAWLASAIAASYLSERKGYGEKAGLVTGMLVSVLAVVVWLVWPPRRDSRWKLQGAFGRGDGRTVAQLRSEQESGESVIAQISQPAEGLSSGLLTPLYLVAVLYVVLFVAGRVLEGREDGRADTVQDAAFALLLLAGVYVAVLLVVALFSEFDLIADLVQIMAIVIGFFAVLVVVLLGIELLVGLRGRSRERKRAVPPPTEG